jgi:methyltransferase (TIGR00027 family)
MIENVSDTALWVAHFRAKESARPNALFNDHLAGILSGERGKKIAETVPYATMLDWIMVVRTVAIDRLILDAIKNGFDLVLNLGAGLDTRPYRLELPSSLPWIEVDFSNIINLKNEKLKLERPRCALERVALDLSNRKARQEFFGQIGTRAKKILVITEGVILYLSNADAGQLADDLLAVPSFSGWIQDYRNGGYRRFMPKALKRHMKASPFLFDVANWFAFFEDHGWTPKEVIKSGDESRRIGRAIPFPFPWNFIVKVFPRSTQKKISNISGYVMMGRKS